MTNKKKIIIIFSLLASLFVIFFLYISVFNFFLGKNEMTVQECPYFNGKRLGRDAYFNECKGVISVLNNNICNCMMIYDDLHDFFVTEVKSKKQYLFTDKYMYIYTPIDKNNSESYFNFTADGKKYHTSDFFINGKVKMFMYDKIDDIPQFIKIDLTSGSTEIYTSIEKITGTDSQLFSSLINNGLK